MERRLAPAGLIWAEGMRSKTASIALAGFALVTASSFHMPTYVVWNVSDSMPRGLYWIKRPSWHRGDIVSVRLPAAIAGFAARRAYLPKTAVLIKKVAASGGDQVCRFGTHVYINVRRRGSVQIRDRAGRPMPAAALSLRPAAALSVRR